MAITPGFKIFYTEANHDFEEIEVTKDTGLF